MIDDGDFKHDAKFNHFNAGWRKWKKNVHELMPPICICMLRINLSCLKKLVLLLKKTTLVKTYEKKFMSLQQFKNSWNAIKCFKKMARHNVFENNKTSISSDELKQMSKMGTKAIPFCFYGEDGARRKYRGER